MFEFSQAYGDIAGTFSRAPHRVTVNLKQHRGGAHSIEGRGALAVYDENEDRLTLWSSTQLAHEVRAFLMTMLRLDENQVRVAAPDVGGGFGAKFVLYRKKSSPPLRACGCANRSNGSRTAVSIFYRRSRSVTNIGTSMWPSTTTAASSGCAAT
jgi:xanthine dehydrogenase molybdopterin-binding subunit B